MYRPYKTYDFKKASADIKVPEPRMSKFVLFLISWLGWIYLFLFFGVAKIVLRGKEIVFDIFKRALAGKSRCIIAFRHPNGGEPQLLSMFFLFKLRNLARKHGVRFERNPHAVMVYGYEVVRYGGWVARFVMPNLGAMPIHHSKMDKKGMERIYNAIINGQYPIALSPEGQVSYTTDFVPRLENGTIRIGMHAAEKLAVKDKDTPVEILPVSIHFRFGPWGTFFMKQLLVKTEKFCGFDPKKTKNLSLTERLQHCRDHILEINEQRYNIKNTESLPFDERLDRVINCSLETAERMLGINPEGDFFARLYRVRHECWDKIFLPGVDDIKKISRVQRCLLDLGAGEAWHIMRHQELADFGWYFKKPLPCEDSELHKKVEFVQNLWDFANRTMGGTISHRANIFPRRVIIHAAPTINLTERLEDYKEDKKTVINELLARLEKSYSDCIEDAKKNEHDKVKKKRKN